MAQLTLAKLMDAVIDEIPNKEQAVIVRALNKVIRRIQTEYVEPVRSTVTTKAKLTTGTVAINQDATTVTFSSSVLSASNPIMLIRVDGDSTWFMLTYVSGTSGTLSSAWAAATVTAATYEVVFSTVTFPKEVGAVTKMYLEGSPPLMFMSGGGCPYTIGTPLGYCQYLHDSTAAAPSDDLMRYFLTPAPDTRMVIQYLYRPRTAFIATDAATSVTIPLPDVWEEAILEGTLYWLWKQESDKSKAILQSGAYEAALRRARGSADAAVVLEPSRRRNGLYAYEERPAGGTP